MSEIQHKSDCAVHNEPAYPAGSCTCGAEHMEKIEAENAMLATAHLILSIIAEGYPVEAIDGRYVRVENPNYKPDNGSEQFIVYDVDGLCGVC